MPRMVTHAFRFDKRLWDEIVKIAQEEETTPSKVVRTALRTYVRKRPKPKLVTSSDFEY